MSELLLLAVRELIGVLAEHASGRRDDASTVLEFERIVRDARGAIDNLAFSERGPIVEEFRRRVKARRLPP